MSRTPDTTSSAPTAGTSAAAAPQPMAAGRRVSVVADRTRASGNGPAADGANAAACCAISEASASTSFIIGREGMQQCNLASCNDNTSLVTLTVSFTCALLPHKHQKGEFLTWRVCCIAILLSMACFRFSVCLEPFDYT